MTSREPDPEVVSRTVEWGARTREAHKETLRATVQELARSMAHDINQPLGAMLMTAKACRRGWENGSLSQDQIQNALDRIAADAQRASDILARFRAGTHQPAAVLKPTDVNTVIEQAVDAVRDELTLLDIALEVDLAADPLVVNANRRLEQAVVGLLEHAQRAVATLPRGERSIVIRSMMAIDEVVIEVRDQGPALTKDDLERIFDPFMATPRGTTGLELAIARAIIDDHDGRIWAVAAERGATFVFALPAARTP